MGHGVIRSSDHWAGWSNCTNQASCIWGFQSSRFEKADWRTGYCSYDDFQVRRMVPIRYDVTSSDRALASLLVASGGVIDASVRDQSTPLPPWVSLHGPDFCMLPRDARENLLNSPEISRALYAPAKILKEIHAGASSLCIGRKLEVPDLSWTCQKDQTLV